MKKYLSLLVTFALALSLAACGGNNDTPSSSTTTPPVSTPPAQAETSDPSQKPPQDGNAISNSPLTLQIIDSHNGIFCLNDPNLKDTYTAPNKSVPENNELYQWSCGFEAGANNFSMRLSIRNMSNNGATQNIAVANGDVLADVWTGDNHTENAFSAQVQVSGTKIYFKFSIPTSYDVDLYALEDFGYTIIDNPNNSKIQEWVSAKDMVVTDVETGVLGGNIPTAPEQSQSPDTSTSTPPSSSAPSSSTPAAGGATITIVNNTGFRFSVASIALDGGEYSNADAGWMEKGASATFEIPNTSNSYSGSCRIWGYSDGSGFSVIVFEGITVSSGSTITLLSEITQGTNSGMGKVTID